MIAELKEDMLCPRTGNVLDFVESRRQSIDARAKKVEKEIMRRSRRRDMASGRSALKQLVTLYVVRSPLESRS